MAERKAANVDELPGGQKNKGLPNPQDSVLDPIKVALQVDRLREQWIPRRVHVAAFDKAATIYVVTDLSSHAFQIKSGTPRDCSDLLKTRYLSDEVFGVLNSARIPQLTDEEKIENEYVDK